MDWKLAIKEVRDGIIWEKTDKKADGPLTGSAPASEAGKKVLSCRNSGNSVVNGWSFSTISTTRNDSPSIIGLNLVIQPKTWNLSVLLGGRLYSKWDYLVHLKHRALVVVSRSLHFSKCFSPSKGTKGANEISSSYRQRAEISPLLLCRRRWFVPF